MEKQETEQYEKIESGKFGFFSKPYLATAGPDAGKIIKQYHHIKKRALCEELVSIHDEYFALLRKAGISVPDTEIRLVAEKGGAHTIRIVQSAFPEAALVRNIMQAADFPLCERLMRGIIDDAVTVLVFMRENPKENMGFHPTLRNYSFHDERLHYFDTFPPFCRWGQRRVEEIILEFAPFGFVKYVKPLFKPFMHRVTDEYYFEDKMVLGIVGSSCRLRPEFYQRFLDSAKEHVGAVPDARLLQKQAILDQLSQPPSLSPIWVFTRRMLGKEGQPNLKVK
ncbi:MAG TPA: DUF6206 family protein [Spirochaetota bacterium]|nr:DUF6206 family protein [Spirochaetota bacterium]HNT10999.1 DUF6206 family protein [Spirochaetota bacterium]